MVRVRVRCEREEGRWSGLGLGVKGKLAMVRFNVMVREWERWLPNTTLSRRVYFVPYTGRYKYTALFLSHAPAGISTRGTNLSHAPADISTRRSACARSWPTASRSSAKNDREYQSQGE